MTHTIISNSFTETQQFGVEFAQKINKSNILALYGDLGSGKTTFVQGLAQGLGIRKKIISPTFIILRSYEIDLKEDHDKKTFYHVDLYRIGSEKDIEEIGLPELMQDPVNLLAIEWPGKIKNLLPKNIINIYFEYIDENKRKITLK